MMPNCDACYGEKTEDCPENCLIAHVRFLPIKLTKEDYRKIDPLEEIILKGFHDGLTCRGIAIEIYKYYHSSCQRARIDKSDF